MQWYLRHGFSKIAVYLCLHYSPGTPFSWFTEDVSNEIKEKDFELIEKELID